MSTMVDLKTIMDGVWVTGAVCGAITVLTGGYLVYRSAKKDREIPEGEPVCNLSPFNNQCNRLALDYSQMQREGATKKQLAAYVRANPITTTEGQWK